MPPMSRRLPWIIGITLPLLGLLIVAWPAATTLMLSGIPALLVLAAGAGYGTLSLRWLRLTCPWQAGLVAAALGTGLLGHLSLGLALAGLLNQLSAALLAAGGAVAGIAVLRGTAPALPPEPPAPAFRVVDPILAIALAVPLGMILFAATLPPGTFWLGEARGYDVLEYHLQGPREWFLGGRMQFLPHNVYTVFPQQAEVLYLLLMHLVGDAWAAAVPSQILHALLTIAGVAAAAAFAPAGWPRRVVLLAVGTVPWLVVVGSLAYVEGALLFYAVVAGGLLLRTESGGTAVMLAAGACAGLAGGCKYTALALVAAALPVSWLLAGTGRLRVRLRGVALFALAAAVVFAPWALRNAAWTGNPVYPFAYEWFGGAAWSPLQDAQWASGHRVQMSVADRVGLAFRELLGRQTSAGWQFAAFGGLFAVGGLALLLTRTRRGLFWLLWLVMILLVWGSVTHLPGRFAIVALAPLAGLLGEALGRALSAGHRVERVLGVALGLLVLTSAAIGGLVSTRLLRESAGYWQRQQIDVGHELAGQPELFRDAHVLNQLPPGSRLWLIGDAAVFYIDRPLHYTVVFGRDPWLEQAEREDQAPQALVAWLRERGWTHVAVQWPEVERLRQTYGFSERVTPAFFDELQRRAGLVPVLPEARRGGYTVWELPG